MRSAGRPATVRPLGRSVEGGPGGDVRRRRGLGITGASDPGAVRPLRDARPRTRRCRRVAELPDQAPRGAERCLGPRHPVGSSHGSSARLGHRAAAPPHPGRAGRPACRDRPGVGLAGLLRRALEGAGDDPGGHRPAGAACRDPCENGAASRFLVRHHWSASAPVTSARGSLRAPSPAPRAPAVTAGVAVEAAVKRLRQTRGGASEPLRNRIIRGPRASGASVSLPRAAQDNSFGDRRSTAATRRNP